MTLHIEVSDVDLHSAPRGHPDSPGTLLSIRVCVRVVRAGDHTSGSRELATTTWECKFIVKLGLHTVDKYYCSDKSIQNFLWFMTKCTNIISAINDQNLSNGYLILEP